ncbi:hypothetical protein S83_005311, partial [Arachis hypogaea]
SGKTRDEIKNMPKDEISKDPVAMCEFEEALKKVQRSVSQADIERHIFYIIVMVVRMELKNHEDEDGELLVRTYQCKPNASTVHHENVHELST